MKKQRKRIGQLIIVKKEAGFPRIHRSLHMILSFGPWSGIYIIRILGWQNSEAETPVLPRKYAEREILLES